MSLPKIIVDGPKVGHGKATIIANVEGQVEAEIIEERHNQKVDARNLLTTTMHMP